MQMVILAGGLATRLHPLTERVPKSLILIQGKPFLQYQIELLKRYGITDLLLCTGFLGNRIKLWFDDGQKFGVRIQYSEEKNGLLGTGGALKNAEEFLGNEFFVMYGDSYLFLDYQEVIDYFHESDTLGLMVVYKNHNKYDKSNVIVENGFVKVYDKSTTSPGMIYIDAGLSVLKKEVLAFFSLDKPFPLDDIFQYLISRKELAVFETKQRFYEIGSIGGLKDFRHLVKKGEIKA